MKSEKTEFIITNDQHKYADFKNVLIEKKFLGALITNQKAFEKIVSNFNPEVFTNLRLRKIFLKMYDFYYNNGTYISGMHLLETMSLSAEQKVIYRALYKQLINLGSKRHSTGYVITCRYRLEQLYHARLIEIGVRETIRTLMKAKSGNFKIIEKATGVVKDLSAILDRRSANSIKINPVNYFDRWMHDYNKWQKHPNQLIGIDTGIPPIDKHITGLRNSEFGLCIADTGVGKSIFLLDVAINCWRKHGDVIYVTIEMPAEQLMNRFWCNLSNIHYNKFRKLTLNDEDKKLLRSLAVRFAKNENKFHILDMNEGCTVQEIVSQVEPYIRTSNVKLIVIDYMNIIASPTKTGSTTEVGLSWETQVAIAMNLKQRVARKFNLPVWSACQVTGDNLAFAKHIKDNIDIGIKFDETELTEAEGILEVSYPKSRDFRGSHHKIKTDRGRMKFNCNKEV
jgi:replicative DNA helicase